MKEVLKVTNLGPIKQASLEPRPLTIFIGPQASGKSLLAQCLYFYRGLENHIALTFPLGLEKQRNWQAAQIKSVLDSLRRVPFGYFANHTAKISYINTADDINWDISIYEATRGVHLSKPLKNKLSAWADKWEADRRAYASSRKPKHIFIPTERSILTRLSGIAPGILYDDEIQPFPFSQFAELLERAKSIYSRYLDLLLSSDSKDDIRFILECQVRALRGKAYIPSAGHQVWKWRVAEEGSVDSPGKILPIEATASGQMEAWPFFVVAIAFGNKNFGKVRFYLEEPETHLHPAAQIEVANVVAYLINKGHSFVLTTHSPFLLYVFNNMIMRYQVNRSDIREGKPALNYRDVAVYRLREGKVIEAMDRDDTNLISEEELDRVANQIGGEFDELLGKVGW